MPSEGMKRQNVFSIPPGRPFLKGLALAILSGDLPRVGGPAPSPVDLSAITLYLPTRRATRALEEAFLEVAGGRALLLPKILPISEGDEDASLLALTAADITRGAEIGPAISGMHRHLILTKLVLAWSEAMRRAEESGDDGDFVPVATVGTATPAQAATLASELARLMDMVETEDVDLAGLERLVPDHFSEHWQKTLRFLEIVTANWPAYLEANGLMSPAMRRSAVIHAEARRLESLPPGDPVIVAGVTGSVPATAALMSAVARLDNGAIVLPALDTELDETSWRKIVANDDANPGHPEHPQHGLAKLLLRLGLDRGDVSILPGVELDGPAASRQRFLSEAMRPSSTTGAWAGFVRTFGKSIGCKEALSGLSLIEAPGAEDEAEAIALILREAAEKPGQTAALVSPDRLLARRVAVRLESWGIRVDDSAGRPFGKTVPGAFLDLVIDAWAENFAPAALMALLKHPLTRLGRDPFSVRAAARVLEVAAFRAPYLGTGLSGIPAALERARFNTSDDVERVTRAVRRLFPEDWDVAAALVADLENAFLPLHAFQGDTRAVDLRDLAAAHVSAAEGLARLPSPGDAPESEATSPLWHGEAGETAQRFFAELKDPSLPSIEIPASAYADLYRSLVVGLNVRPRVPVHPCLSIWGPYEARLQQPDIIILGSLNDGTWPDSADPGPWLNRTMRASLGLPAPEEQIGFSAHDFATLAAGPKVYMTRAEKVDGVPTVPSRWLLRIKALLEGAGATSLLAPEVPWLGWARARDAHVRLPPRDPPAPCPPLALRPRRLSVSAIETWIKNPYAIFAREILGLEPLTPLGEPPGPALRGSIIHAALARFAKEHPSSLPSSIEDALVGYAHEILAAYRANPRIAAFWVPRFERFARWFADSESDRRSSVTAVISETTGSLVIDAPAGAFTLRARADRIDVQPSGLVITDYKTGSPPARREVEDGIAPQLPLEALIAEHMPGFAGVPPRTVSTLRYIQASGAEPPGQTIDVASGDLAPLLARALEGLKRHVAHFDDPSTPYRAIRRARFSYDYDDYAHLARVDEWSAGGSNGAEGE